MTQESLLKALEEDASTKRRTLMEEAGVEGRDRVARAEAEAASIRDERCEGLKARLTRNRAAALNKARAKKGGLALEVRHSVIEEVFEMAVERIKALESAEYSCLLTGLYNELKDEWKRDALDDAPVVLVNPADIGAIKLADNDAVELKPDSGVELGVVFVSADGRVRYENTVASRLKSARPRLLPVLDRMLFD